MFYDQTLSIYTSTYLIRGEIPFNIMFTVKYEDYKPDDRYSIGIKFLKENLIKANRTKYLELMTRLIRTYSNNEVNLICCDGMNKECTLAYIGDFDFLYYHLHREKKEKMYYEFFDRLCDNNYHNITYIGDTLKQNSRVEEIERVDSEIISYHMEVIAKNLGIGVEELIESNRTLTNQVLSLSRK